MGVPEVDKTTATYDELKETEWSPAFESCMRNRLILGAYRYGRLRKEGKPQYDRINAIRLRIEKYEETGNMEYLVDIANLCLCEFEECHHPKAHFSSIDSDEQVHVRRKE